LLGVVVTEKGVVMGGKLGCHYNGSSKGELGFERKTLLF